MAALTPTLKKMVPNQGLTCGAVKVTASDSSDTIAVTLSNIGISTFLGIQGYVATTAGSVIVTEAPTTAVSAGVLTITVGGSTVTNKTRLYLVYGE